MTSRPRKVASACLLYTAVMSGWTYGFYGRDWRPSLAIVISVLIAVTAVHLATGYIVGFWALPLAVVPVLLALPAGSGGLDVPLYLPAVVTVMPLAAVLLAVGASIREVRIRRRAKDGPAARVRKRRWTRSMRSPRAGMLLAAAALYAAVMGAWTYWVLAELPQLAFVTYVMTLVAVAAASFLAGYIIGFAAVPLALVPALLSLVIGLGGVEVALSELISTVPLAAALLAAGASARRAGNAARDRRRPRLRVGARPSSPRGIG